ncbi:hypothetical protein JKP88DRAFT_192705 [Tribonema minus]|uniref:Nop domain-containing protein n=1 Tax=Tribonema minus TaxID=303371 RepID=A0A836CKH5_9STRA|nr:hypothetical protein JKP88DRAFT_192705 [Tribonema minus]
MSTLADSFLQDLDELDSDEESQEEQPTAAAGAAGGEEDSDAAMDDGRAEDHDATAKALKALESREVTSVAKVLRSERYLNHMKAVLESMQHADDDGKPSANGEGAVGSVEQDPQYQLIVKSNEFIADIDDELVQVHRFVVDAYSPKFPELESIVTDPGDYIRTVQLMKNEMDMTRLPLDTVLPQTSVMVVSVTGSTTPGKALGEAELKRVLEGCAEFTALAEAKSTLLTFVEGKMSAIAPNMCAIIGSRIAAQLMGQAGGLAALSNIPACNLQTMGQERRHLAGFATTATGTAHAGLIFYSDLVQSAPVYLRRKLLKVASAKVTLAVRCDLHNQDPAVGRRFRSELEAKLEKWQEPDQAKIKRALPKPDEAPKSKRGGKRVRRLKEKFTLTDIQKEQNKMGFASQAYEYGDSAMGRDFGMLGKAGNRMRAPAQKKTQQLGVAKKLRMAAVSSGNTNGLSSSIIFTPVQGIELVNPNADKEAKVKAANAKWFDTTSGFMSAKPK